MKLEIKKIKDEQRADRLYISQLEKKILDIQSSSRSAVIEIRNGPVFKKETTASLVVSIVSSLGSCSKVDIKLNEICDIFRIPGKKGSAGPVVAELSSVLKKNEILGSVRAFNKGKDKEFKLNTSDLGLSGKTEPIYVAERLPPSLMKLYI